MNKMWTVASLLLLAALALTTLGPWKPYVVRTGSMTPVSAR